MEPLELLIRPETQLYVVVIMSLFGLGVVARVRLARDPTIGKPIFVVRDSVGVKPVLFALQAGLFLSALMLEGFPVLFAGVAIYGACMLTWLSPGMNDLACGESGIIRGWYGRRYEELEAWQIEGEHLRFRLFGTWTAIEIPSAKRARLRAILERAAPERESRD